MKFSSYRIFVVLFFSFLAALNIFAISTVTESVQKISPSKKIFIISNENNSIGKGDFITLILEDKRVYRALVAKISGDQAGIKILKIYDELLAQKIEPQTQVKILRGDDSFYEKSSNNDNQNDLKITDDDDLYNSTVIDDNLEIEDEKDRILKNDNLVGFGFSQLSVLDINGNDSSIFAPQFSWSYQFQDNLFIGGHFAYGVLDDFPSPALGTKILDINLKLHYVFEAPLYVYILPFVGYQIRDASANDVEPGDELDRLNSQNASQIIFGISVLKRFVPGWFIKLDLGTDQYALGIALEF